MAGYNVLNIERELGLANHSGGFDVVEVDVSINVLIVYFPKAGCARNYLLYSHAFYARACTPKTSQKQYSNSGIVM